MKPSHIILGLCLISIIGSALYDTFRKPKLSYTLANEFIESVYFDKNNETLTPYLEIHQKDTMVYVLCRKPGGIYKCPVSDLVIQESK